MRWFLLFIPSVFLMSCTHQKPKPKASKQEYQIPKWGYATSVNETEISGEIEALKKDSFLIKSGEFAWKASDFASYTYSAIKVTGDSFPVMGSVLSMVNFYKAWAKYDKKELAKHEFYKDAFDQVNNLGAHVGIVHLSGYIPYFGVLSVMYSAYRALPQVRHGLNLAYSPINGLRTSYSKEELNPVIKLRAGHYESSPANYSSLNCHYYFPDADLNKYEPEKSIVKPMVFKDFIPIFLAKEKQNKIHIGKSRRVYARGRWIEFQQSHDKGSSFYKAWLNSQSYAFITTEVELKFATSCLVLLTQEEQERLKITEGNSLARIIVTAGWGQFPIFYALEKNGRYETPGLKYCIPAGLPAAKEAMIPACES
jgi:hypothetical protein